MNGKFIDMNNKKKIVVYILILVSALERTYLGDGIFHGDLNRSSSCT